MIPTTRTSYAPVVVFDDVDVDAVLDIAVISKFRNAGQVCLSPTRFYPIGSSAGSATGRVGYRLAQRKAPNGTRDS